MLFVGDQALGVAYIFDTLRGREGDMIRSHSLKWTACLLGTLLLTAPLASGQSIKPDALGFIVVQPDDVKFADGGQSQILIAGDPTKPGIYVIRIRFAPHQTSRPHFHNQDRYVTVIKGTWWVALGPDSDVYDMSKTVPMKAGGFVKHPAGSHHYDGAKDEEAIVQIVGMGPVTTTQVGK
jgi:quercetin dioxygenase-like cupin family protein